MNVFDKDISFIESFDEESRIYKLKFKFPTFAQFVKFYGKKKFSDDKALSYLMDSAINDYFKSGRFIYDIDLFNISEIYNSDDEHGACLSDAVVDSFLSKSSDSNDIELTGNWNFCREGQSGKLIWDVPNWFDKSNYMGGNDLSSLRSTLRDLYVFS